METFDKWPAKDEHDDTCDGGTDGNAELQVANIENVHGAKRFKTLMAHKPCGVVELD